jgi:hypothetical protein
MRTGTRGPCISTTTRSRSLDGRSARRSPADGLAYVTVSRPHTRQSAVRQGLVRLSVCKRSPQAACASQATQAVQLRVPRPPRPAPPAAGCPPTEQCTQAMRRARVRAAGRRPFPLVLGTTWQVKLVCGDVLRWH